jgi:hypothetical protein
MADVLPDENVHLIKEVEEIHSYARHDFGLLVGWFTFFCTSNYVALGLFASALVQKGKLQDGNVLLLVAGMFIVQSFLGLIVCVLLRKHFSEVHVRLANIAELVTTEALNGASPIQIPRALTLYRRLTAVMILGVASLCLVWIALPLVSMQDGPFCLTSLRCR